MRSGCVATALVSLLMDEGKLVGITDGKIRGGMVMSTTFRPACDLVGVTTCSGVFTCDSASKLPISALLLFLFLW